MNKSEKTCGFYTNTWHFTVMSLPHIGKMISSNKNVILLLEENLTENAEVIINKMILNDKTKQKILNINWDKKEIKDINKIVEKISNNSNIIVMGNVLYVENVNKILDKQNKIFNIFNFYEATEFNSNIEKIINSHKNIINTTEIRNVGKTFAK